MRRPYTNQMALSVVVGATNSQVWNPTDDATLASTKRQSDVRSHGSLARWRFWYEIAAAVYDSV